MAAALLLTASAASAPVRRHSSASTPPARAPRRPVSRSNSRLQPRAPPRSRLDRLGRQRRAAEIGVHHDAGRVDHPAQHRAASPRQGRAPAAGWSRRDRAASASSRAASSTLGPQRAVRATRGQRRRRAASPSSRRCTDGRARSCVISPSANSALSPSPDRRIEPCVQRRTPHARRGRRMPTTNPPDLAGPWRRVRLQAVARRAAGTAGQACPQERPSRTCWSGRRRRTTPRCIA